MKFLKKTLSRILAILITVAAIPFYGLTVSAAGIVATGVCGSKGDNVTWMLYNNGILAISGTGNMEDYNFSPWTDEYVKTVVVKNGVTSIGRAAFRRCTRLTSVTFPDSVTSIGSYAFAECSSLTSVTIPNGVTNIEDYAFIDCTTLTSVTLPDNVAYIGRAAFAGCSRLTYVIIPDSVTDISASAFYDCSSLAYVTIPDNVTSIGSNAFHRCFSLTDIYYTGSKEEWKRIGIGPSNISLTNANIHYDSIKEIPGDVTWTLIRGDPLTTLIISGTGNMKKYNFRNNFASKFENINAVVIKNGITSIGDNAFSTCSSLTSVTIPDSVTSIGEAAFRDCSSLTDIYYAGGKEEWKQIRIDVDNDCLTNANIHYNTGEISVIKGDLDGDGKVTLKDSYCIKHLILGEWEVDYSSNEFKAADMNGDDVINTRDVYLLKKLIVS